MDEDDGVEGPERKDEQRRGCEEERGRVVRPVQAAELLFIPRHCGSKILREPMGPSYKRPLLLLLPLLRALLEPSSSLPRVFFCFLKARRFSSTKQWSSRKLLNEPLVFDVHTCVPCVGFLCCLLPGPSVDDTQDDLSGEFLLSQLFLIACPRPPCYFIFFESRCTSVFIRKSASCSVTRTN